MEGLKRLFTFSILIISLFFQLNCKEENKLIPLEKPSGIEYAGTHILADFWNCDVPQDPKELENVLIQAAKESNSTPLEVAIHKFEPEGITGVIILAESHISVHYWPELDGYASIDVFTCGKESKPNAAIEYLKKVFKPAKAELTKVNRGKIEENKLQETENLAFGLELTLDLFDCNPETIDSKEKIAEFNEKLCDLIEMKRYGKPFIERFANGTHAEGYSLAQMIETSLVSGHFAPKTNSAYINIFSCKKFDPEIAKKFTQEFFGAKEVKSNVAIR